ncbi:DUF960 family protein [Ruminococcus sp.]|uniref:DUF960 family protein n=1 Tax=Ruminococcus sp. TaxID=41978 RepID=UPI0039962839
MFSGKKYLTKGIYTNIPLEIQQFLWRAVETMPAPKDYLQVFVLCIQNGIQVVHHSAEQSVFDMTYVLPNISEPVSAKIYIIDDYYADENQHIATMLLSEEY